MLINTNIKIYHILRLMRPRQWIKNLSIFAASFFGGEILNFEIAGKLSTAFILFCLVSSATYLVNDSIDAEKDTLHPIKKNRPIPSGKVSKNEALFIALVLISLSLIFSLNLLNFYFFVAVAFYIVLQLSYSLYFRNVIIMDALAVAIGFIIRVFAGGFAAEESISSWIVLSTIGLSLLLAFGKRRSEKTILSSRNVPLSTRKTLEHYPDTLLDSMISMSSAFTLISYAIFSFQTTTVLEGTISKYFPVILAAPKLMMLTIPIVIYGVARYLYVIYEKNDAESPERVLLSDKPLLTAVFLWVFSVFILIYAVGSQINL